MDTARAEIGAKEVSSLIGKLLTHVEAMGLTPSAEKANKDLIRQAVHGWWRTCQ